MILTDLPTGHSAVIVKIKGHGAFRKRMMEMGFVKGRVITPVLQAPMRDPIKYKIMNYEVSLRRSEASMVEVEPMEASGTSASSADSDVFAHSADSVVAPHPGQNVINVALVGNPNCGKTSLFNVASGAHEHVGNYSGVTVDLKRGHFDYKGYKINIIDLPGTYSLASYSPEELYVRNYLRDQTPDVIVNVVVASNLERNLYLTTELIDMDRSMVIALNMYDELERSGDKLNYKMLGEMIGVPIVPTISRTGDGLDNLFDTVISVFEGYNKDVRHVHVTLNKHLEAAIKAITAVLKQDANISRSVSPRYMAIKLLEDDASANETIKALPDGDKIIKLRDDQIAEIAKYSDEDISTMIADEKYGFIEGALAETLVKGERENARSTELIDAFVTNKLFGFPLFLLLMFVMFWLTFTIGQYPMDWLEGGVGWLSGLLNTYMPDGALKDLIADGIVGGVGSVIVFLPQILILYMCISFMEDSGYMARAAFIMDHMMHKIGLHGKSFIPMIMGFGCNVPAIMATRSIESRSSRLITILINPFMSCSARVPIYVLLIGAFFSAHAAWIFLLVYCIGVAVAMLTAKLLRKFYFKEDETPFVMELPPYRMPTGKAIWRHTWAKGQQYLRKMGGIILLASIVVWALNYFPLKSQDSSADNQDSYLEMIGKAVNPVFEPLGWPWRATVAVVAGIPAKEVVVSTLGVLYTGDEEADEVSLSQKLTTPEADGSVPFTPAVALGFMVFVLLYCPCLATIVAIVKESGSWKYGAFSIVYNTAVAWLVAFIVYRAVLLFS